MDQYTRRIIGFGVHAGTVDGVALCRMSNRAIRGECRLPKYLSSDHDPPNIFHQWQANLQILAVTEVKTVSYVPLSRPFVERLMGTIRREYLDHTLYWPTVDLENGLLDFRNYYNHHRTLHSWQGGTNRRETALVSLATPLSRPLSDSPRLPEFSRTRASCEIQVTVGKDSNENHSRWSFASQRVS
jgi:hypothetical protein